MNRLPTEIIHYIAFSTNLSPTDVANLAQTCRRQRTALFGPLSSLNTYDLAQHRALAGIEACVRNQWWRAAALALRRRIGNPNGDVRVRVPVIVAAAEHGAVSLVKDLVDRHGIDPSVRRNLALYFASRAGHVDIVSYLLRDPRVNPCARNNASLRSACKEGHANVVRLLADDGRADPSDRAFEALFEAAAAGHSSVIRVLLDLPNDVLDPRVGDTRVLALAVKFNQLAVVETLLQDPRVNPWFGRARAARIAGKNANIDILRLFIARIPPNAPPISSWVKSVIVGGSLDCIRALAATSRSYANAVYAHLGYFGSPPVVRDVLSALEPDPFLCHQALVGATKSARPDILKIILKDGRADPKSPSFWVDVVSDSPPKIVETLLTDPRVDPTWEDSRAIRIAICAGNLDNLTLLLRDGRADPSARKNKALRQAVKLGNLKAVSILIADYRVDPGCNNQYPLFRAVAGGHADIVRLLLANPRVDPRSRSSNGKYIYDIALLTPNPDVISVLQSDPRIPAGALTPQPPHPSTATPSS